MCNPCLKCFAVCCKCDDKGSLKHRRIEEERCLQAVVLQLNSAFLRVPAEKFSCQELGPGVSSKTSQELKLILRGVTWDVSGQRGGHW